MAAPSRKLVMQLLVIFVLVFIGLSACDKPIDYSVVIEYEEAAVFSAFDPPPAPGGSVPIKTFASGLYVAYRIISIQNTAAGAKDFAFDPNKLFVGTTPPAKLAGGVLGPYSTVKPTLVAKGTTAAPVGRIIIDVPGDPKDIKIADNNLFYESGPGESVLFNRRPVAKKTLSPGTPSNLP